MSDLSRRLMVLDSFDGISYAVLEVAKRLTGSKLGYVGFIDPKTGYLVCPTMTTEPCDIYKVKNKAIVLKEFNGLWGWVLLNKEPLITNNLADDQLAIGIPPGHLHIERFLSIPAMLGDELVGQISLANSERDYTERDITLVEWLAVLYANIIQRKWAEDELKASEDKYRRLYETMMQGVIYRDDKGEVISANPAVEKILGLALDQMRGTSFQNPQLTYTIREDGTEFTGGEYPAIIALKTGKEVRNEILGLYNRKEGRFSWVNMNSVPQFRPGQERPYQVISTFDDITERKKTLELLSSERQKFETLIKNSPHGMMLIDKNGVIAYINPAFNDIFGYEINEFSKLDEFFQAVFPDPADRQEASVNWKIVFNIRSQSEWTPQVCRVVCKDGSEKFVSFKYSSLARSEHLLTFTDLTQRIEAEKALRESEKKYRRLVEIAQEGIWAINEEAGTTFVNQSMAGMLGYTVEEMTGTSLFTHCESQHHEMAKTLVDRCRSGLKEKHDWLFIGKDGRRVHTIVSTLPATNEDGKCSGAMVLVTDITERKIIEDSLRASEERLRGITDSMMDLICQTDTNFFFQYASPSYRDILGYEPKELLGKSVASFVHKSDFTRLKNYVEEVFKKKQGGRIEYRCKHIKGHYLWLESNCKHQADENGQVSGIVFGARDITRRKKAEEKINKYQKQLRSLAAKLTLVEEQERRRIATDIHDQIGQPLAVAKIELGVLKERMLPADSEKIVNDIYKHIDRAIHFTRSLVTEISPPVLYEIGFEAAVESLGRQVLEKRGVRVTYLNDLELKQMDDEISVILFTAVREILINIIKHAKAEKALIAIKKTGSCINIKIRDYGCGFHIPKNEQAGVDGGGFGLFSIRERLKHVGGTFKIKSSPGCGTCVTMEAPLRHR